MVKTKVTNVSNVDAKFPSQIAYGDLHVSTEHPGFSDGLMATAGALGMDPNGLFYLIQYGFAQSLQDAIAGKGKAFAETMDEDGNRKYNDAEVKVMVYDLQKARLDAIMEGKVGHRTQGPRAKGLDKVMAEIAWETIVAAAAKVGKSLPKKASEQAPIIANYLAKYGEKTKAAAEARMADATSGDVGDLLDNL